MLGRVKVKGYWRTHIDNPVDKVGPFQARHILITALEFRDVQMIAVLERWYRGIDCLREWGPKINNPIDQLGFLQLRHRFVAALKLGNGQVISVLKRRNERSFRRLRYVRGAGHN